jgi:hypothetical protein
MENYTKFLGGASILALLSLGCSSTVQQSAEAPRVAVGDACSAPDQSQRPQWRASAESGKASQDRWRPQVGSQNDPAELTVANWRPSVNRNRAAPMVASCDGVGTQKTY